MSVTDLYDGFVGIGEHRVHQVTYITFIIALCPFVNLFKREEGQPVDLLKDYHNMISIIRILANANIAKENSEIALGMRDGDKQEKFTDEMLESLLDLSHISEYLEAALRCMGLASAFEVPDDLKLEEPDEDLEEINAEKNP